METESIELKELRSPYGSYVIVPASQEVIYKASGYKTPRRKRNATTSATEDIEDSESETLDPTDNQEPDSEDANVALDSVKEPQKSGKTRKE